MLAVIFTAHVIRRAAGQRLLGQSRHAGFDRLLRILYALVEHLEERVRASLIGQPTEERSLTITTTMTTTRHQ